MNEAHAIPPADPAPDSPAEDWPDGHPPSPCGPAQIAMLDELAELAMRYARHAAELGLSRIEVARKQASAREPANPGEPPVYDPAFYDPGLYDPTPEQNRLERMTRSVRMTLSLRARLLLDLAAWDKRVADAAATLEQHLTEKQKTRQAEVKRKAGSIVGEVVETTLGKSAAIDAIRPVGRWFNEREEFPGLFDRPIGEIVAMICRDLGHPMDWSLWQDRPWGADAVAATPPAAEEPAPEPEPAPDQAEGPDESGPTSSDPAATDTAPTRAELAASPEVSVPPDAKPGEPVAPPDGLSSTGADPPAG